MTKAILTCFHKYTPFGGEFYEPILDFYLTKMRQFDAEYDHIYLIDSNWGIQTDRIADMKASVIKVNPHLRYYDAYKHVLPDVKEDLVLFLDNDMVIYRKGIISKIFGQLDKDLYKRLREVDMIDNFTYPADVVSIYATIGNYKTDKLNGKNKFCPFLFATMKDLLMQYRDCDWGPNMPEYETLGKLTEKMLGDEIRPYEMEEDYSKLSFNENGVYEGKSKDLGYYHIQAGSTPAYLLAAKHSKDHNKTYWEYLKNQPRSEYLRQLAWYDYMIEITKGSGYSIDFIESVAKDLSLDIDKWTDYMTAFIYYHGL